MTALGWERFAMVGHDCGMWVGYAMAADQPERIARIALGEAIIPGVAVSPPLIPDERPLNDFLWHNNFCRLRAVTEELVVGREDIFFDFDQGVFDGRRLPFADADLDRHRGALCSCY